MESSTVICTNCGYPQNGTAEQKQRFSPQEATLTGYLKEVEKNIKTAKIMLFAVGGLQVIGGIITHLATKDIIPLIMSIVLAWYTLGSAYGLIKNHLWLF